MKTSTKIGLGLGIVGIVSALFFLGKKNKKENVTTDSKINKKNYDRNSCNYDCEICTCERSNEVIKNN